MTTRLMGRRRWLVVALVCCALSLLAVPAAARDVEANTGRPGSRCAASDGGATFSAPDRGVRTTGLGHDAPAYYEIGRPSGAYEGRAPKAIMLVIHGGAWYLVGKGILSLYGRPLANRWRRAGWTTVNIDYRACAASVQDVLWFMQRVRSLHPRAVICATGSSAGGHLAMLLAGLRQDLACAISYAGATDLVALDTQFAVDASGRRTRAGPELLSNLAVAAFGAKPNPLEMSSPSRYASKVTARVLLATGRTDPLVPRAQDKSFAQALRAAHPAGYVDVLSLPPGPEWFVHTRVSRQSLTELRVREAALVAPLLANT